MGKCGYNRAGYLAKHDLARASIDYQLQGCSIDIQDNLTVGDAGDGQAKPERPIGHLPECLQTTPVPASAAGHSQIHQCTAAKQDWHQLLSAAKYMHAPTSAVEHSETPAFTSNSCCAQQLACLQQHQLVSIARYVHAQASASEHSKRYSCISIASEHSKVYACRSTSCAAKQHTYMRTPLCLWHTAVCRNRLR